MFRFTAGNISASHNSTKAQINYYSVDKLSIQDIIRRYRASAKDDSSEARKSLDMLPDKVAIQLNDTHPSLAIPELMRILVDIEGLSWEKVSFVYRLPSRGLIIFF